MTNNKKMKYYIEDERNEVIRPIKKIEKQKVKKADHKHDYVEIHEMVWKGIIKTIKECSICGRIA